MVALCCGSADGPAPLSCFAGSTAASSVRHHVEVPGGLIEMVPVLSRQAGPALAPCCLPSTPVTPALPSHPPTHPPTSVCR